MNPTKVEVSNVVLNSKTKMSYITEPLPPLYTCGVTTVMAYTCTIYNRIYRIILVALLITYNSSVLWREILSLTYNAASLVERQTQISRQHF